ncbi:hypothetical protein [Geodermatophilus sp. URMC 60]
MRGDREDASARPPRAAGPASPRPPTLGLVAGAVLAVVATVVVFLTDDPRVLRLAVVAAAWAFVLAALVASRRSAGVAPADGAGRAAVERAGVERAGVERAAAEREAELRLAYELELEREVAARREHELRVENDLRRTAEQSMRAELEALRAELAPVSELRREMAQLTELRREMAQLTELRREVAEVAGLRRDLTGLAELRTALAGLDLTALADVRADVGRLRTELTEQLSAEMLVERVLLRTQSTRTTPAAPGPSAPRTVEADSWTAPAPELTAAWPAVRADEPAPGTRQVDELHVEPRRAPAPPPPLDWLASRSLLTPPSSGEPEPRRRRTDTPGSTATPAPDERLTTERPVAQRQQPPVPGPAAVAPTAEAPDPAEEASGRRLAELVAESGLTPPSGGRRRRRYREDDESDDVLARVLGR